MKLKLTLLLCAMTLATAATAQDYFVPGTTWIYEERLNWWPMMPAVSTITLVEAVSQDGEACLQEKIHLVQPDLNSPQDEVLPKESDFMGNYIKVEGEKVYAASSRFENAVWLLAYDFSLLPGEGCLIPAQLIKYEEGVGTVKEHRDCYFKFEETVYNQRYGVDCMKMNVYESVEDSADEANAIWTDFWLKGIGAEYNFTSYHNFYVPADEWAGWSVPVLKCATAAGGEIVAKDTDWSGIESVSAESPAESVAYYDLQGRRLSEPAEGAVTIVRLSDGSARKIVR